jgi:hypothetical protein
MRKITETIREAWLAGESKKVGNTYTDGSNVWLHGNEIIQTQPQSVYGPFSGYKLVYASLAGWNRPTTRERLKIVSDSGAGRFTQKDFEPMLDGTRISKWDWHLVGFILPSGEFAECLTGGVAIDPIIRKLLRLDEI